MTIFAPIVTGQQVETAVLAIIERWLPTYLTEVERQSGINVETLARPASYQVQYDWDNWPETQIPAVIVVCTGTNGDPERLAHGEYGAWWNFGVGVVVSDDTQEYVRRASHIYAAAVRATIVQNASLGGFSEGTYWLGETHELPETDNRSLGLCTSEFTTFIPSVVTQVAGPTKPDPLPDPGDYGDDPLVQSTSVDVTGEPIA